MRITQIIHIAIPTVAMTDDTVKLDDNLKGTAVEILGLGVWNASRNVYDSSDPSGGESGGGRGESGEGSKPVNPPSSSTSAPEPTPTYFDIIYELYGGKNDDRNPVKYQFGKGVDEFFPATKPGYDFVSWYSSADMSSNPVKSFPTDTYGDRRLFAKFKPKTYNITYVLFDGINDETNPVTYTYGVGVPEFKPATKPDHIFKGWFKDEALTQPVTSITNTDMEDITLYAGFEINLLMTKRSSYAFQRSYMQLRRVRRMVPPRRSS